MIIENIQKCIYTRTFSFIHRVPTQTKKRRCSMSVWISMYVFVFVCLYINVCMCAHMCEYDSINNVFTCICMTFRHTCFSLYKRVWEHIRDRTRYSAHLHNQCQQAYENENKNKHVSTRIRTNISENQHVRPRKRKNMWEQKRGKTYENEKNETHVRKCMRTNMWERERQRTCENEKERKEVKTRNKVHIWERESK